MDKRRGSSRASLPPSLPSSLQAACGTMPSVTFPCMVYVGVTGWGASGYSVALSGATRSLTIGMPMPGFAFAW